LSSYQDSVHAHARDMQSIDHDRKLTARSVARRLDVSVRTIDRWLTKSHMRFPPPVMTTKDAIGRIAHRYWRLGDILEWERRQAALIPNA
jgi:predicted DNA-binding transcriptional regulator AlpA